MPGRVFECDLTVPAGTLKTAPVSAVAAIPDGVLVKITLVIPPGHAGLTGIAVLLSGTPIVPYAGAAFISGDHYTDSWELDQEVNAGQVVLSGYNLDAFPHTFFIRALWIQAPPTPGVTGVVAGSSGAGIDVTQLGQAPADTTLSTTGTSSSGTPAGAACYDINGNVVDCSDPSAVTGPVTNGSSTGGTVTVVPPVVVGPGTTTCYNAAGQVVDCSDPSAVSSQTIPTEPVPIPGPPITTPPPPPPPPPPPRPKPPPPVVPHEPGPLPRGIHGPYRQIATGKLSLDQVARERRTTAAHLIDVTRAAEKLTRAELVAFNHYVAGGIARPMHKGLAYYTSNP